MKETLVINRILFTAISLSICLHVSAAALLGHYGHSFDELEHSVIEVEILLEGDSNEVTVISPPPRKTAPPVPKLEKATE